MTYSSGLLAALPADLRARLRDLAAWARALDGALRPLQAIVDHDRALFDVLKRGHLSQAKIVALLAVAGVRRDDGSAFPERSLSSALCRSRPPAGAAPSAAPQASAFHRVDPQSSASALSLPHDPASSRGRLHEPSVSCGDLLEPTKLRQVLPAAARASRVGGAPQAEPARTPPLAIPDAAPIDAAESPAARTLRAAGLLINLARRPS